MQTTAPHIEDLIGELAYTTTGTPNPPHEVQDQTKLAALVADMAGRGWQGPPVVVHGENALTGSHRIAAHCELWNSHGVDVPVPRIEISDVCAAYGVDWADTLEAWAGDEYEAAEQVTAALPAEVVEALGLDLG